MATVNCHVCQKTTITSVYVVDHDLQVHLSCLLEDLDLNEAPSIVADPLRDFCHSQATRAIDMVLGR
jgi:hypothetical protein